MKSPDPIVEHFGDLVFDFLEFLLGTSASAMLALKPWLESLKKHPPISSSPEGAEHHDELQVQALRRAAQIARPMYEKLFQPGKTDTYSNPLMASLAQLRFEERATILLKDRLGISLHQIARVLLIPEDHVRLLRSKALQRLAEGS